MLWQRERLFELKRTVLHLPRCRMEWFGRVPVFVEIIMDLCNSILSSFNVLQSMHKCLLTCQKTISFCTDGGKLCLQSALSLLGKSQPSEIALLRINGAVSENGKAVLLGKIRHCICFHVGSRLFGSLDDC